MTKPQIRALDRKFSLFIRSRGSCEKCGTTRTLQTSHIYSRRYMNIRWHPLNAFCFCAREHMWWHHQPIEAVAWAQGYMNADDWTELQRLKRVPYEKTITPSEVESLWQSPPASDHESQR